MRTIDADKVKAESREHCKTCILNGTKHCDKTCVINLICDRLDLQPTVELTTTVKGDLISRDALKTAIEDRIDYIPASDYDDGWNNAINAVIDEIDNAPTVKTYETFSYEKGFQDGAYSAEMERLLGKRTERALSIIDRLYTEGHINNMEQGVLRRCILFSEKGGAEE